MKAPTDDGVIVSLISAWEHFSSIWIPFFINFFSNSMKIPIWVLGAHPVLSRLWTIFNILFFSHAIISTSIWIIRWVNGEPIKESTQRNVGNHALKSSANDCGNGNHAEVVMMMPLYKRPVFNKRQQACGRHYFYFGQLSRCRWCRRCWLKSFF